ncbi:hypothetical protein [Thermospira aquatica]|uniref:Uncharacterized protein n=1 Tax=Thermospira aquatica TaxID=2828656 RepID=A0AAX3BD40_9SPIR|nr:hypothetical protein [Thermospira aquatica]URA10106.1 hypothetical protein KDW03_11590 [Thermospira aquatica]
MRMDCFFFFAMMSTNMIFSGSEATNAVIFSRNLQEEMNNPFVHVMRPAVLEWDVTNTHIVAFYGHPKSRIMGIVGRLSRDELAIELRKYAQEYEKASGKPAIPAVYLIYGTCQPGGEIGIMSSQLVQEYITFTETNGFLLFLDHQIGKYSVEHAVTRLLPFMKYPHVHPAIDPEWRTLRPMKEIGSITADELNNAQKILSDYLVKENILLPKIFVVHQFNWKMIRERQRVKTHYPYVYLVHTADGFGSPDLKKSTYAYNAQATNMPYKGFKLFFYSGYKGAGYDQPLMKPEEVVNLKPTPFLIIYQ